MKLTDYQISKIQTKIKISPSEWIVLLDVMADKSVSSDEEKNYNVYRINELNEIIWQINELKKTPFQIDMFVYIGRDDEGNIIADRWSCYEYHINPETGEAKCIRFHK